MNVASVGVNSCISSGGIGMMHNNSTHNNKMECGHGGAENVGVSDGVWACGLMGSTIVWPVISCRWGRYLVVHRWDSGPNQDGVISN